MTQPITPPWALLQSMGVRVRSAGPVPARVPKLRAPQVDHQETGPDPDATLMVRKQGVGTITFDTTMGETMVSGARRSWRSVEAGTLFRVFELDGGMSEDDVKATFAERKAEDDARAQESGNVYTGDFSSVDEVRVQPGVAPDRQAAVDLVMESCRKWEWVSAVRYKDADGGESWLMGGDLAD